jgi:recombinase
MKAKAGRCEGMKPFGHAEDERLTVTRIVELRGTGMALDKIALALNAEGHKPKYGQRWHASSVSNVLKREAVAS